MASRPQRFIGKVVLVTGAGGGLGSVQARMFAEEGAAVVLTDVDSERGEAAAVAIREAGGNAIFTLLDVTSAAGWIKTVELVRNTHGKLHVLVNNAGVVSRMSIRSIPLAEWERVININLLGPMLGIQSAAALMHASGGGSIVNISSTAGLIGHPGVAYTASKWGLRGVTKCAALEFLDWRIRVNSVHPAQVTDTLITSGATPAWRQANERVMPEKRPARPDEVTHAVLFLASDEASYINGTELTVDGGAVSIGLPRVRALLEEEYNKA